MNRDHIDWDAAYAWYAAKPPHQRSYGAVARRFGVSDTAVRKQARSRGWAEKVRQVDARSSARVDTRIVRDRASQIAKTLEIVELAEAQLLEQLRNGSVEVRPADLPALVKLRELLLGEATGRVERADVHLALTGFFRVAIAYIDPSRRAAFLIEVEAAAGGFLGRPELEQGEAAA